MRYGVLEINCVIKFTERLSKRNAIYIKIFVCLSRGIKGCDMLGVLSDF